MIATFYFDEAPPKTDVVVTLFRARGEMFGDVVLSGSIADQVLQAGFSDAATLPIGSALAYAVFLAVKLALPLTLTGDRAAWDPAWGPLLPRSLSQWKVPRSSSGSTNGDASRFQV
jgi:hypothetical protein